MGIFLSLSALALRQIVGVACEAMGIKGADDVAGLVGGSLAKHFANPSQRLLGALRKANDQAWQVLEIALTGDSFWDCNHRRPHACRERARRRAWHIEPGAGSAPQRVRLCW
jgi:hypothetical protein